MEEHKVEGKAQFDEQIYINVQQNYYTRLKDVTKRLRQIEKDQLDRVKRIYGISGGEELQISELDGAQAENKEQELMEIEEEKVITSEEIIHRKGEINKIVK